MFLADTITAALDADGSKTLIENAIPGGRYTGLANHKGCRLYPAFPKTKRASYRHMPSSAVCSRPKGESKAHRATRSAWFGFIRYQLSGCHVCMVDPTARHLKCPAYLQGVPAAPFFHEIVWGCDLCLRPHNYDLLRGASRVVTEKKQLGGAIRPDLTILDADGQPLAFIEIKKTNLSENVRQLADANEIPLFVVEVVGSDQSVRFLNNPDRYWPEAVRGMSPEFQEMVTALNRSQFAPYFEEFLDGEGRFIDALINENCQSPDNIPHPSVGAALYAHWSNLPCPIRDLT